MALTKNRWAIVLAAGEGTRLKSLTTNAQGITVPKQFCAFRSSKSMLTSALERAERLVPRKRIVTVVSSEHGPWWRRDLAGYPEENIVIQPRNRGTAAGLLLPLIEILRRDSEAQVAVFPSDHYVEDEEVLEKAFENAMEAAHWKFHRLVLLGMTPEEPDTQYGWIVPSSTETGIVQKVSSFVEKPPLPLAQDLFDRGAYLNSFMFAAPESVLLKIYREIAPNLIRPFLKRLSDPSKKNPEWQEALYEALPTLDFSRDLLERATPHLGVLSVPFCGWSDLGTPERVLHCLEKFGKDLPSERERPFEEGIPLFIPELFTDEKFKR
jgi:mannose-1-phosphate guanylyltransferase